MINVVAIICALAGGDCRTVEEHDQVTDLQCNSSLLFRSAEIADRHPGFRVERIRCVRA